MQLRVLGRANKEVVEAFKNILDYNSEDDLQAILFCDYSEFDIPIGEIFNSVEDRAGNQLLVGEIKLSTVSQQFLRPFDGIPRGYKTICKFILENKEMLNVINDLPVTAGWYVFTTVFIFK